jgi:hypothetical protein
MNFHVWGPISIRHNDSNSLFDSHINRLIVDLQLGNNFQFVVYGDSAYIHIPDSHVLARHNNNPNSARHILENRALSSSREVIEWDYGDVGSMWSFLKFSPNLKTRGMYSVETYLTAMSLRNMHVTMNGCNTSNYFSLGPPSFAAFMAAGPR